MSSPRPILSSPQPSSSIPLPRNRPRPGPSDVFRPKLPLDPFAHIDIQKPWLIPAPLLTQHLSAVPPRQVVLVLGEPLHDDLQPLLSSQALSASLLLIATHAPQSLALPHPALLPCPGPAIRILHLPAPLAIQDSGALRLVSLFERAERVARAWRSGANHNKTRLVQLAEATPGGQFTRVEEYVPPTPKEGKRRSSPLNPNNQIPSPPSTSPASSTSSLASSLNSHSPAHSYHAPKPSRKHHSRPFDAIFNFLPSGVPEKSLLKHAILVSTISAPFLTRAPPSLSGRGTSTKKDKDLPPSSFHHATPSAEQNKRGSIFSTYSFSTSEASVTSPAALRNKFSFFRSSSTQQSPYPGSAPTSHYDLAKLCGDDHPEGKGKAKLVHILPAAYSTPASSPRAGSSTSIHQRTQSPKPKLAQGIEQFLLSFSYPLASLSPRSASAPSSRSSSFSMTPGTFPAQEGDTEKPAPFILAPRSVGHMLPNGGRGISVGEVILLGLIDPKDHVFGSGRAWIGSGESVIVTGGMGEMPDVVNLSISPPSSPRGFDPPAIGKGKGKEKMRSTNPLPTPPSSQESVQDDEERGIYMPRSNSSSSSSSGGEKEITVPPAAVTRNPSVSRRSASLPTPVPASVAASVSSHSHSHSQQYETTKSRRGSFFGLGSRSPSVLGHFSSHHEKRKVGKMEKVGSKLGFGRFWKGDLKVAA